MIRNTTLVIVLAAGAFAAGGAAVAYAQAQDGGGMGMKEGMVMMAGCPMMRAAAEGPAAVLEQRERLNLSEAQVARLEELREAGARVRAESTAAMRELHRQIEAITSAEPFDEAAARDAFGRMGDLHGRTGLAMARARHETRSVLTPEQRETLSGLSSGMMGDMGDMDGMDGMEGMIPMRRMMEMMRRCPMMGGGTGGGDGSGGGTPGQGSL